MNRRNLGKIMISLLSMFFLLQSDCGDPVVKNFYSATLRYAAGKMWIHGSTQILHYILGDTVAASDVMDHLAVTGSSVQTAGTSQTITITAIGGSGNAYTAYTGDKTITFSGAGSIGSYSPACTDKNGIDVPFGTGTVLTFTNGVATCNLKLYKSEKVAVAFTDGSYGGLFRIDISPLSLDKFEISAPAIVYNNLPFSMTVTARDQYGNFTDGGENNTLVSVSRGAITPAFISSDNFHYVSGPDGQPYTYKKEIDISNNVSQNLTGYQVKVILDTASLIYNGKMQEDCDDLRFAEENGNNIPYWIESGCNTSSTTVWIKTDLNAGETKKAYAYYGNGSVGSESDGNTIFEFFDEFNGTALDMSKWTTGYFVEENNEQFASLNTGYNTPYVSGGNLIFDGKRSSTDASYEGNKFSGWWGRSVTSVNGIAEQNFIIESSMKFIQSSSGGYMNQYASHVLGVGVDNDNLVFSRYRSDDNSIGIGREVRGAKTNNTPTAYTYDSSVWKKAKLTYINDGTVYYQVADSSITSYTVGENISTRKISLAFYHRAPNATVVQDVDWVLVRQYASVEATVVIGPETYTGGVYIGNFIISGIDTAGDDTITITNGSIVATVVVYVDIMDHLAVIGSSVQTAGTSQTITITAIGGSGNAYTAYTGDKTITFSGAGSIGSYSPACTDKNGIDVLFGTGTVLTFTNGVATCNLKLYKNETAVINATDGSMSAVKQPLPVTVSSDINAFSVAAPATAVAGGSVSITLIAEDSYGNIATAYTGDKTITFSGAGSIGSYSPACTDKNGIDVPFGTGTVLTFTNGVATCNLKLYKSEKVAVAFTDGSYGGLFRIDISPLPLDKFEISAPASTKSGAIFPMTIIPRDCYGNNFTDISENTLLSVNQGTINGTSIPASSFWRHIGPDNESYTYKKEIDISNNVSQNLTGYQVKVILDTASLIYNGKMQEDCDDLRFAEENGNNIPYWIESGCNTSSTTVWIKTDLNAGETKKAYAYYGNGSVGSESDASGVFIFYDDFENGLSKWNGTTTTAAIYNENGDNVIRLIGGAGSSASTLTLPDYQNIIVESRFKFSAFGAYGPRFWQSLDPIQTIIESYPDGSNSAWHQTWLGATSDKQIARSTQSWSTGIQYSSKLISTDSMQRWEVGTTVLSGTYVRAATISGGKLKYETWDSGNDLRIYWVKIRRYAAVDPTVAIKTEEHAGGIYSGEFIISGILQDTYVTIALQNGGITSAVNILVEAADHMDHFKIEGMGSQMAGFSQTITVIAIGESGNLYPIYEGDHGLIFFGASSTGEYVPHCNDIPFGVPNLLRFTDGVAMCDLKLYKAETALLTANDGEYDSTGGNLRVEVLPAGLNGFDLSVSDTVVSEAAFPLSIGLHDAYGNVVNNVSDDVSLSVSSGSIAPSNIVAGEFSVSGAYAGSFTVSQIYTDASVSVTFSSGGIVQTKNIAVRGVDHMDHLRLSAKNQMAGIAQTVTVAAIGLSGNIYTPYSGNKRVTFFGVPGINGYNPTINDITFGTAATLIFSDGTATAAMKLYKTGTFDISIVETAYSAVQSVTVTPASLNSFDLAIPSAAICEEPFVMALTARDAYGNISTNIPNAVSVATSVGNISPSFLPRSYFTDSGVYSGNFIIGAIYADMDITITFQSGSVNKEQLLSVVGVDKMNYFSINGLANQKVGETQVITVFAMLDSGNIDTSYSGDKSVIFSGTSATNSYVPTVNDIPFGTAVSLTFTDGIATAAMKLYKAGIFAIGVSDGIYSAGGYELNVAVVSASMDSLVVSAPDSVTSGTAFSMTITAKDIYGNSTTQISEDVHLTVDIGTINPASISAASFASGGSYVGSFTLGNILEDSTVILTVQSGSTMAEKSMAVTGVDTIHHFRLDGIGAQVAGETQIITVTAIAISGEVDTDYEGSHNLIFSGASGIDSYNPTVNGKVFGVSTSLVFTEGIASCNLILYKTGDVNINANDGTYNADGHTLSVTVVAASIASFDIAVAANTVSETPFPMTFIGRDAYANIAANLAEDIVLTVNQGNISPAVIAKTGFQGSGHYSCNFTIGGIAAPVAIEITFTAGSITATKNINVHEMDEMDYLRLDMPSSQMAGTSQYATITAVGISGNTYAAYTGEKALTFFGAGSVGDYYSTANDILLNTPVTLNFVAGVAHFNFRLYKAEKAVITATDGTYDMQASEITVYPAPVSRFVLVVPEAVISGIPFNLSLDAFDAYGNAGYNISTDIALSVNHGVVKPAFISASNLVDDGSYTGAVIVENILQDTDILFTVQKGNITQSASIKVAGVDVMDHFTVTAGGRKTVSHIAGASQFITITAMGASGNIYAEYNGSKSLVFYGAAPIGTYTPSCIDEAGIEIPFGSPTALSFVNGIATCELRLYKTGIFGIAVSGSGHISAGHDLEAAVSPGDIYSFAGSVPTVAVSGVPFFLSLIAKDRYGNTVDMVQDTLLSVSSGTVTPSVPAGSFQNGSYIGNIVISGIAADTSVILTVASGSVVQNASILVTGIDLANHLQLSSLQGGEVSAGIPVQVNVSIVKADGSAYTEFTGIRNIVFSGAEPLFSYEPYFTDWENNHTSFASGGILSFVKGIASTQVTLFRAGETVLQASDGFHDTRADSSYSFNINVLPGRATSFYVEVPPMAETGASFPVMFVARDEFNNTTAEVEDDLNLSVNWGTLDTPLVPTAEFATGGSYIANIAIFNIGKDTDVTLAITSGSISQSVHMLITAKEEVSDTGSGAFIFPPKPDISNTRLILSGERLDLVNIPLLAVEISVSDSADFLNSSWENIEAAEYLINGYLKSPKIYIKFRGKKGGISDVIIYSRTASVSTDIALGDGDIVRAEDSFDIYVIKFTNGKQFRRLILSPKVFSSYQHLKWENVKTISLLQVNRYVVSNFVQARGDKKIYELFPSGDIGEKRALSTDQSYDPDAVYEINEADRDSYILAN